MPRVNFATVPDPDVYEVIPAGRYLVKIAEIQTERTKEHGDEMWRMTQEIVDGPYRGRRIFDRITFSDSGLKRVKLVCSRFGLDTSREVDLQPDMLLGCVAMATVSIGEYQGRKRNEIPFAGYERAAPEEEIAAAIADEAAAPADSDGDVPF
jgi:hypothetical protein